MHEILAAGPSLRGTGSEASQLKNKYLEGATFHIKIQLPIVWLFKDLHPLDEIEIRMNQLVK